MIGAELSFDDGFAPFILVAVLFVGVAAILAMVFTIIVVVQTRPPDRPEAGADGVLRFHAHMVPAGRLVTMAPQSYGEVAVTVHELIWTSVDGSTWRVPIPALAVLGHRGFLSLSAPGLMVELPGSGSILLQVSDRPINRFMRNDFKRSREAGLARQLADTLVARGARLPAA